MASAFDADFAAAGRPALISVSGQDVVYNAPGIVNRTIKAVVLPERLEPEDAGSGEERKRERDFLIGTEPAAAEGGVADPPGNGTATITYVGEDWSVVGVDKSGSVARLRCVRDERVLNVHEDYFEGEPR